MPPKKPSSLSDRAGNFIRRHPKLAKSALGFAALGSVTIPPTLLAGSGVGEDTQAQISYYCSIGSVDETGNLHGTLAEGPYGGSLDLFLSDRALYDDWVEFQGQMRFADQTGTPISQIDTEGNAFQDFYRGEFLPAREIYKPEDVYDYMRDRAGYKPTGITAISEVPVYHELHDALKNKVLDVFPTMDEGHAHSYAHAAVGNMLLLMRASAIVLPQIASAMRKKKQSGGNDDHCHTHQNRALPRDTQALMNALEAEGITPEDLDKLAEAGKDGNTQTLLDRIQGLAQGKTGKLVGALGMVAVAAAMAPSIGMGTSYYAGLVGADSAIPVIVEATGMTGHEASIDVASQASGVISIAIAQANTHLASCIVPAVGAGALAMLGKKKKESDQGRGA